MIKLINLFLHLGLHIGTFGQAISYNMYYYLMGYRYAYSIFNPWISILLIRRVIIFLILSSKLNIDIVPILYGFKLNDNISLNIDANNENKIVFKNFLKPKCFKDVFKNIQPSKKKYPKFVNKSKLKISKIAQYLFFKKKKYLRFSEKPNILSNDIILLLFRKYNKSVLLNKVGLLTNWYTYYEVVSNNLFGRKIEYPNKATLYMFSVEHKNMFLKNKSLHLYGSMCLRVYFKLYQHINLNENILQFRMDKVINEFKKFHIFIKLMLYLRAFKKLPSILLYLDSIPSELKSISKFRICLISLVNSNYTSINHINYPIPTNFGSYLSKIFYSYLFLNSYHLGRIMLLLTSLQ